MTKHNLELPTVPRYVAEWFEQHKDNLEQAIIDLANVVHLGTFPFPLEIEEWFADANNNPIRTLLRMEDGYTIQEDRWVVKFGLPSDARYFRKFNGYHDLGYNYASKKEKAHVFTDRAKAEAVATLVDGSVEGI